MMVLFPKGELGELPEEGVQIGAPTKLPIYKF